MSDGASPKKVVVLGSTGSIGESSLKVARDIPERMEIVGLAANRSVETLAAQINEFGIKQGCLYDPTGLNEKTAEGIRTSKAAQILHGRSA